MKKMLYAASFVAVTGFAFADPTGTGGKTAVESDAEQIVYGDENAVTGAIDGQRHQYNGLYFGVGFGSKHLGHNFVRSASTATKALPQANPGTGAPAAQIFAADTTGGIAGGGNPLLAADLTALEAAVALDGGRLVNQGGGANVAGDFVHNGAGIGANNFGLVDITNNDYSVIYTMPEITIDQQKSSFSGSGLLGYGITYRSHFYLGLECMYDFAQDKNSDRNGVRIKTKGGVPITALRLGMLYNGWLVYAKIGMAQQDATVNGLDFNHTGLLLGGGLEKAFCNAFTVRLDADWIKGKDKKFSVAGSKPLRAGAAGAAPAGRYGYAAAENLVYNQDITFKKKDSWNIRLIFALHP